MLEGEGMVGLAGLWEIDLIPLDCWVIGLVLGTTMNSLSFSTF